MRSIVWFITLVIVGLWSLASWVAYELVTVGGRLVAGNADLAPVPPELVELISWVGLLGADIGGWVVAAVWAVVAAILLGLAFLVTRLLPGARRI